MASKVVEIRRWTCDGCGNRHDSADKEQKLPVGWTDATTVDYSESGTKGIDLCSDCSKDPETAKRKFKETITYLK